MNLASNHDAFYKDLYSINKVLSLLTEPGDPLFLFPNVSSYNTNNQLAKFDKNLSVGSIDLKIYPSQQFSFQLTQSQFLHFSFHFPLSSSSLVLKILKDAHNAGKKFRVVVVDSRPKFEGNLCFFCRSKAFINQLKLILIIIGDSRCSPRAFGQASDIFVS